MSEDRLGIGIIGSGFNARFHLQAFVGVRDADVRGIWSPNEKNAAEAAKLASTLDVGEPKIHRSIAEMTADQLWAANARLFTRWLDVISGKYVVVVVVSDSGPNARHWILSAYIAQRLSKGDTVEWRRS